MANSFSPPRRNAMAPVQPVANVPMAVAPLYSAPTPQDAEVLKRFLLGAGKAALAGVQFPGDLMHDAARSLRAGRPAGVYADLVETARRVSRDPAAVPGMVVNALKSQAEQARSSPGAMAETMGGMLDVRNMLRRKPTMAELDVYHGTPHTFEPEEGAPLGRFRSSKIGTGEGAQAYGHGLYFAENPDVAGQYRQIAGHQGPFNAFLIPDAAHPELQDLSHKASLSGNHAAAWVYDELLTGDFGPEQLLRKASKEELPAVREALANAESVLKKHKGSLYKVDLPDAKIEQMLDWDKPLSEQSENVRKALMNHPAVVAEVNKRNQQRLALNAQNPERLSHPVVGKLARTETTADSLKGQALYELLASNGKQAAASEYLRSLGIPGIKYLDAGSRDGGKGTRNFVVFPGEEQHLNILSRD